MTDTASTPPASSPAAAECRNCGAPAAGAYCPQCGQETSFALPTVRSMLREAAGRYVALDGRMWRTLIALLFRPGFLTCEYFSGRRRRYIRPARLFLVLSIGLFALLRFVGTPPLFVAEPVQAEHDQVGRQNADADPFALTIDAGPTPHIAGGTQLDQIGGGAWLEPLRRRAQLFNHLPRQEQAEQIFAGMTRYGPYAAFVLLPLFALLLKLVYTGRTRRYPARPRRYAAHLVFGAHNHAFLFLVVALFVLLPSRALRGVLAIWAIVYLLRSMRRVYGGRWSGVFARAAVIAIPYAVLFVMVVGGLVVAAILLR